MLDLSKMDDKEMEDIMKKVGGSGIGCKVGGKKKEVLDLLKSGGYSIGELRDKMMISSKNVSCLLNYNRNDGWIIEKIGKVGGDVLILWGFVKEGEKVGNRIIVGEKGYIVRWSFKDGCLEDEIKKDEVKGRKKK